MPIARQLACAAIAALACVASAQQVYRIVGPDGRVTFSDKPPTDPTVKASPAAVVPLPGGAAAAAAAGGGNLPFELRQVVARYPVTFYSGPGCGPCENGRGFLTSRGIPFTEKTVSTGQDIEALTRMSGSPSLPFLTIGGQQLKGYSEPEWSQFLDAAGYPKTSVLPGSYRPPAATALVDVQEPPRPAVAGRPVAPARAPEVAAPEPAPSNPAGIRF
jgi:glutaredoxin